MQQSTFSVRGQTVIPQQIREQLGIKPKTKLNWIVKGGVILVMPIPDDPVAASVGILAGRGYTLDDFLKERREERELERRQEARLEVEDDRAARGRKR